VAATLLDVEPLLAKNGVNVVLVASSTEFQAKEYLDCYELDRHPGILLLDPSLKTQKAFGCKTSIFHSLITPVFAGVNKFGLRGVIEGIVLGSEIFHLAGASWIQGGMFAIKDGRVLGGHLENFPGDWPGPAKFESLLSHVLPASFDKSSINMDYQQGLSRWLDAREAKKKERAANGVRGTFFGLSVHLMQEIAKSHAKLPLCATAGLLLLCCLSYMLQ